MGQPLHLIICGESERRERRLSPGEELLLNDIQARPDGSVSMTSIRVNLNPDGSGNIEECGEKRPIGSDDYGNLITRTGIVIGFSNDS